MCGVDNAQEELLQGFYFEQILSRAYYCPQNINGSIHIRKQATSTHPFCLPVIITQISFMQVWMEILEGKEREYCKLLHIPSEGRLKFSFCSFHSFNFCNGGGRKRDKRRKKKKQLCCNANEHIYKALPETVCFSLLLLAILKDILLAVAQKALSVLLYFLIQNAMTLFGEGLVLQHISQYQYCIIQQLDSFCSVITKPITVNYTAS